MENSPKNIRGYTDIFTVWGKGQSMTSYNCLVADACVIADDWEGLSVCNDVNCVCMCPHFKRKTAWAINAKVGRHRQALSMRWPWNLRSSSHGYHVHCRRQRSVCKSIWLLKFLRVVFFGVVFGDSEGRRAWSTESCVRCCNDATVASVEWATVENMEIACLGCS